MKIFFAAVAIISIMFWVVFSYIHGFKIVRHADIFSQDVIGTIFSVPALVASPIWFTVYFIGDLIVDN